VHTTSTSTRLLKDDGTWTSYYSYRKQAIAEAGYHSWTKRSQDSHKILIAELRHGRDEILPWMAEKVLAVLHHFAQQLCKDSLGWRVWLEDVLSIQDRIRKSENEELHGATVSRFGGIPIEVLEQSVGTFRSFLHLNAYGEGAKLCADIHLSAHDFYELACLASPLRNFELACVASPLRNFESEAYPEASINAHAREDPFPDTTETNASRSRTERAAAIRSSLEFGASNPVILGRDEIDFSTMDIDSLDFSNIDLGNLDFGASNLGILAHDEIDFSTLDVNNLDFSNIDLEHLDFDFNDLDTMAKWAPTPTTHQRRSSDRAAKSDPS
jgi:hypothetical protein